MRIGLVSFRCENRNISFNMDQIRRAMENMAGKADLLCFGEAFLQGFDSLCWEYETDRKMAVTLSSQEITLLRTWTVRYGMALLVGYIEREEERLYSSCAVLADGKILYNYRRISKGWKEYTRTDSHYCEGTQVTPFCLNGKNMLIALCGDMWDCPERFRTEYMLIWPVYVNFSLEQWNQGMTEAYAVQAHKAAEDTLMVNPLDTHPVNHGGAFRFQSGKITDRIPFDQEGILIAEV